MGENRIVRAKVIKAMEFCLTPYDRRESGDADVCHTECPYFRAYNMGDCIRAMAKDALTLLKAQEPRLMTADDFIDNPNADSEGFLPAWIEYRRDGEWADYWDDQQDEWSTADGISNDGYRLWTERPTEEQMKAIPWT